MPFVTQERRKELDELGYSAVIEPGDICYLIYKFMVVCWNDQPRWATVHALRYQMYSGGVDKYYQDNLKDVLKYDLIDVRVAYELAFQVFFNKIVMPYENKKELENGPVNP